MSNVLLFVDDEKPILDSFKRLFLNSDYKCLFAQSAKEALVILSNEKIDLIITDMRMPEINGYELLIEVKIKYPDVIRIILSGYTEEKVTINAIIDGIARAYLTKPWDDDELEAQIKLFLEIKDKLKQKNIMEIINKINQLPVLPALYNQIINLIKSNKNISEIAEVIETEPSYSSKILQIVNSAFYGLKIGAINKAISFLGLENIKNIILSIDLFNFSQSNEQDFGFYNNILLWEHSCLCNKITTHLYQKIYSKKIPDDFASCGLLHNIGMLLILQFFPDKIKDIINNVKGKKEINLIKIEKEVIGISHTEFGAYLFNWWNLPHYYIESCLFHHDPLDDKVINKDILALINIADAYSWKILSNNYFDNNVEPEIYNFLNIDEAFIKKELENINKS